jgi:hypothetical protein
MWFSRRLVMGTAILLLLIPRASIADSGNDDLEHNRRLLEDPERYKTLRRTLQAFLALPEQRQKQLRELDLDLHNEDSATSARLQRVLERYAEWLQRLPEVDRQQVQNETDPKKRLQVIRQLREREWVQRLPKAVREDLQKLPADQRPARIAELRKEERRRREEWQTAFRNWAERAQRPQITRLEELTPEVKTFCHESLFPMLSPEERSRLGQAEGKYPLFLRALVELADKHPIKLPGPSTGPCKFEDVPPELQARLARVKDWPPAGAKQAEGKWPDYALAVTKFARSNKVVLPRQLGPCRPAEFSVSVRKFREEKLLPVLGADDVALLRKAEGNWPYYPRLLFQLARKHGLQVPGMELPGPRYLWNPYRVTPAAKAESLPEVPVHTLLEFARTDLNTEEQASLPTLWFDDPGSRMKVNEMYLERNPKVLQQLRKADQQAQQRKQMGKKK